MFTCNADEVLGVCRKSERDVLAWLCGASEWIDSGPEEASASRTKHWLQWPYARAIGLGVPAVWVSLYSHPWVRIRKLQQHEGAREFQLVSCCSQPEHCWA